MKSKWKRLLIVIGFLSAFLLICLSGLFAFSDSISFFYSPTQALNAEPTKKEIRIGGFVSDIVKTKESVEFLVSDSSKSIKAIYHGLSPALMQEGIEVVLTGNLTEDRFLAKQILIKHDEFYRAKK